MKILVYNIVQSEDEKGVILSEVRLAWNEVNEAIAKAEAYKGQYIIEDDGQSASAAEPTADEVLNALLGVTV